MDYKTISHQWDLAVQYWQAGRYEQSYECFDAIEDPPMAIVFNVAVLQMMHEEYDIAHENFSIILARDPQFAIAYFLRGIVAYHRELYGRARDDFERCLRSMDSRHFISYRPLGMSAVLTEYQVQANLGMICTLLDGESGKGLSHMVNAKSKQDVMLKDDEFKKELSDIGQPLDEELPYFGDIVESCQDGKCPLVQFSPLPYFRNDGLLLKQFRHQQEFNICCKDEESKSAHTLYEKSEDTFKKSRISVFGKMKALKGRQVNALSATLPRANATSPSFLRKSIVDPLPPVVVAPASPGRPESPVVRKRTSQFDCGGTTLAGQSNDVDLGIRRRSRSYHCGLEAVSLLTHPCSSMTDIVAGVSLDEPPALTRRFSRSRRRSRSAEPSMLEFDENSEDNNAMISSRRSVPTFSPIAMEMSLSRERSCSLSNIPAAAGSDPTSPPGVASPGRFTRKVESPLVRSGSATQFTFTDPPKPAAQSPTPTKPSQMNKVTTPNDSSHKPSQHGLHLDQPTSTHDKERGKSPLASYEPAAAVSDEEAVRRVKSPIRSNVVKPKPPLHNDDEFPNKVQTSLRRDESASSVKSYLHRHESSSSCMTNCSSTSGGSASIGMQSESDCFRPVQSSGNSAHKDQQRRHHHHRPSTDSVPSEVSGFASDGSSAAEVDMPTMQQHKRPAPQAYKISCNMQDLVEKISGLGQHHRRGYTINIIVQNQAV